MKTGPASIVKLRSPSAIEIIKWLCPAHILEQQNAGWTVLDTREAGHPLQCDPCGRLPAVPVDPDEEIAFT